MVNAPDFRSIPGVSKEIRDELVATFDALSKWRDEIETVNERCLSKVLVHTSAVARAMGWPDQAIRATREHLETVAKAQTEMIDQIIEGWKRQLKSTTAPMAAPRSFAEHIPGFGPGFSEAKLPFDPLAPWNMWFQAAEMWQRAWMPDQESRKDRYRH
jgi:hypothetical protein